MNERETGKDWSRSRTLSVDRTATWPPQEPAVETALEWKRAVREGDCNVIFGHLHCGESSL